MAEHIRCVQAKTKQVDRCRAVGEVARRVDAGEEAVYFKSQATGH
jgi:hypothetical protein